MQVVMGKKTVELPDKIAKALIRAGKATEASAAKTKAKAEPTNGNDEEKKNPRARPEGYKTRRLKAEDE